MSRIAFINDKGYNNNEKKENNNMKRDISHINAHHAVCSDMLDDKYDISHKLNGHIDDEKNIEF